MVPKTFCDACVSIVIMATAGQSYTHTSLNVWRSLLPKMFMVNSKIQERVALIPIKQEIIRRGIIWQ